MQWNRDIRWAKIPKWKKKEKTHKNTHLAEVAKILHIMPINKFKILILGNLRFMSRNHFNTLHLGVSKSASLCQGRCRKFPQFSNAAQVLISSRLFGPFSGHYLALQLTSWHDLGARFTILDKSLGILPLGSEREKCRSFTVNLDDFHSI